jgi:hypothetical protein
VLRVGGPGDRGRDAVTVQAATKRIGSRICERDAANLAFDFATLDGAPTNGAFGGVLFSNIEACEPNRLITLYEISSDPAFAGSALTNASGAWTIAAATGFWEARADPTLVGGPDAFTYCPAVTSDPWFYEEPPPPEEF